VDFAVPSAGSTVSGPAYPDFTVAPAGWSNNALSSTYPTPLTIPGVFEIDQTAPGTDKGRNLVVVGKVNGELVAIGSVYNWRNASLGYAGTNYVNTGAFIAIQTTSTPLPQTPAYQGTAIAGLPDITSFATTPTDQFILDPSDYSKLEGLSPYRGVESGNCWHNGGHLEFVDTGSDYTVKILAPTDGYIDSYHYCSAIHAAQGAVDNDKYAVNFTLANTGNDAVILELSLEPMHGNYCSTGVAPGVDNMDPPDNGFFKPYLSFFNVGDHVTKGQQIATYFRPAGAIGAHVHFNLAIKNSPDFECPNIFNSTINSWYINQMTTLPDPGDCNGTTFRAIYTGPGAPTSGFCYEPGQPAKGEPQEDFTGL
jgi:hypothetical protein